MSIVFNVIIYYMFSSIRFNEQIINFIKGEEKALIVFKFASIVLFVFSLIFIWYSTSFFMKKRKREIGLYSLFGVKKNQIGRMLFYENIIMGMIALGIGLLLGSILSKLFIMILFRFMSILITVKFVISLKAILNTIFAFGILFLITSIHGYTIIYRFSIIELFKAENVREKEPKTSVIMALGSILIMVIGYIVGLKVNTNNFLVNTSIVFAASIIGTFMFFSFFLVFIVKILKKIKRGIIKGLI